MQHQKKYLSPSTTIVCIKVKPFLQSVSGNANLHYGGTTNDQENRSRTVGIIWDDTDLSGEDIKEQ
jgi:hypothetical protein